MKTMLRRLVKLSSRLLLVGMGLFGLSFWAQTPSTQTPGDQAAQQPGAQNNPAKPAGKTETQRNPILGVAVDSARKSDVLATWNTTENNEGETGGPWVIKQSAEFGGRITDFTGNTGTWDTMVNLGSGPRLFEYTLELKSPTHTGWLFDDLLFSNFGYGGDPNDYSRVRAQKGKVYSFNANFRRDQNIFDYNLFANPLNPAPNIAIINSPHEFLLTRRISDANLNLFPVNDIRFRLGWSRVVNEGNTFSSDHQGTEAPLLSPTLNTTDNYLVGVTFRFIPRTSLNYDQFYTYFKGDTTAALAPLSVQGVLGIPAFTVTGGIPVSPGIVFNAGSNQPCNPLLTAGVLTPTCSAFFSYSRFGNTRNSFPTEQFSFQSNYFRHVDMSGRVNYSDAEASDPSTAELFNGLSRNRLRTFALAGSALAHRLALNVDYAVTVSVTDKFRIVDSFRYENFRIPGTWGLTTNNLFAVNLLTNPNQFTPATCPPPFTAATCPQHLTGSAADVIQDFRNDFLKQSWTMNTFTLEYDFTKNITAHVGYRFGRREITQRIDNLQILTFFPGPTAALANRGACAPAAAHPLNPDGTCTAVVEAADVGEDFVQINTHTGLIGFAARFKDRLRLNADVEFLSADNAFFRISPRHSQDYRVRANYKALDWANLGAAIRILEFSNLSLDIGSKQHNRSYAFSGAFAKPDSIWGLDLSYDYNDIFSQINICFAATPAPVGSLSCGTPFLSGISTYTSISQFGSFALLLKPWKKLTMGAGYAVTSTSGNTLILNPFAPTGPLNYNYHLPTASIAFALSQKLVYKAGWNYYDYNEKSDPGPTLPRDFRGNSFSMSVRYTM
jgi:opacity protein-like surface antigen